jgi:Domain of unknown function (DUF4417)/ParB-like nuclease domain
MATRKKTVQIAVLSTELVSVKELRTFKGNPRVGDIDGIAKSLEKFGQIRAILANKRDNQVIAGNHTYLAARKLGMTDILTSWVDVDDKTAKALVLADNKLAERATYDDEALGRMLADIGAELVEVTGYAKDEFDTLTGLVESEAAGAMERLQEVYDNEEPIEHDPLATIENFSEAAFGDENDSIITEVVDDPDVFKTASEKLPGIVQLEEAPIFEGLTEWDIPRLRTDKLVQPDDIDWDKLKTWAGSATRDDDDPETMWFYNYGIDSTSGMMDPSRMVLSFFAWDDYFENWWWYPSKYVAKSVNSGIKFAVTPDFSYFDKPHLFNLMMLYKTRYLARYMQEAGMKIMPHVNWPYRRLDFYEKYTLPTLPKCPVVVLQLHNLGEEYESDPDFEKEFYDAFGAFYEHTQAEIAVAYCNKRSMPHAEELNRRHGWDVKILPTRNILLGEHRKSKRKLKDVEYEVPKTRSGAGVGV